MRKARARAPRACWSSTRPSRPPTAGRRSRIRNTNAMFDIVRQNPAAEHPPLEGWIQRDLAAQLFAASGTQLRSDEGRRQAQGLQAGRRSRPTSTSTATPRPRSSPRTMSSASCRAATRPDETVIYIGHWDHLGIGLPDANGDRIYNGAIDNGTGIAQLIEQARAFAARPAARALGRVPGRHGRGKGPARQRILCRQPALSGRQDGRRASTPTCMGVLGPARDFTIRGNQQVRPARHAGRGRRQARPPLSRPTRTRKPAASSAPTISPSPRSASRR